LFTHGPRQLQTQARYAFTASQWQCDETVAVIIVSMAGRNLGFLGTTHTHQLVAKYFSTANVFQCNLPACAMLRKPRWQTAIKMMNIILNSVKKGKLDNSISNYKCHGRTGPLTMLALILRRLVFQQK
jgi:hypothetical protein